MKFDWLRRIVESLRLPPRMEEPIPELPPVEEMLFTWSREIVPPHPRNAPGDFYVEHGGCFKCEAPLRSAPDLIEHDECGNCFFRKQPGTPAELDQAIEACIVSCMEAVRYGGKDPAILERFEGTPFESACDAIRRRNPS